MYLIFNKYCLYIYCIFYDLCTSTIVGKSIKKNYYCKSESPAVKERNILFHYNITTNKLSIYKYNRKSPIYNISYLCSYKHY